MLTKKHGLSTADKNNQLELVPKQIEQDKKNLKYNREITKNGEEQDISETDGTRRHQSCKKEKTKDMKANNDDKQENLSRKLQMSPSEQSLNDEFQKLKAQDAKQNQKTRVTKEKDDEINDLLASIKTSPNKETENGSEKQKKLLQVSPSENMMKDGLNKFKKLRVQDSKPNKNTTDIKDKDLKENYNEINETFYETNKCKETKSTKIIEKNKFEETNNENVEQENVTEKLQRSLSEKTIQDELSEFQKLRAQDTKQNKETKVLKENDDIKENDDKMKYNQKANLKKNYKRTEDESKKQELQNAPSEKIVQDKSSKFNKLSAEKAKLSEKTTDIIENGDKIKVLPKAYVEKGFKDTEDKYEKQDKLNKKLHLSQSEKIMKYELSEFEKFCVQDAEVSEKIPDIKKDKGLEKTDDKIHDFLTVYEKKKYKETENDYEEEEIIKHELCELKTFRAQDTKQNEKTIDIKTNDDKIKDYPKASVKKNYEKIEDKFKKQEKLNKKPQKTPSKKMVTHEPSEIKKLRAQDLTHNEKITVIKENDDVLNNFSKTYVIYIYNEMYIETENEYEQQEKLTKKLAKSSSEKIIKGDLTEFQKLRAQNAKLNEKTSVMKEIDGEIKNQTIETSKYEETENEKQEKATKKLQKSPSEKNMKYELSELNESKFQKMEQNEKTTDVKGSIEIKENDYKINVLSKTLEKNKYEETDNEHKNQRKIFKKLQKPSSEKMVKRESSEIKKLRAQDTTHNEKITENDDELNNLLKTYDKEKYIENEYEQQEKLTKRLDKSSPEKIMKDDLIEFQKLKAQDADPNEKTSTVKKKDFEINNHSTATVTSRYEDTENEKLQKSSSEKFVKDDRSEFNKFKNDKTANTKEDIEIKENDYDVNDLSKTYEKNTYKKTDNEYESQEKVSNKLQKLPSEEITQDEKQENFNKKLHSSPSEKIMKDEFSEVKQFSAQVAELSEKSLNIKKGNDLEETDDKIHGVSTAYEKTKYKKTENEYDEQQKVTKTQQKSPSKKKMQDELSDFQKLGSLHTEQNEKATDVIENDDKIKAYPKANDKKIYKKIVDKFKKQEKFNIKLQKPSALFKMRSQDIKEHDDEINNFSKTYAKEKYIETEIEYEQQEYLGTKPEKSPSDKIMKANHTEFQKLKAQDAGPNEKTSTVKKNDIKISNHTTAIETSKYEKVEKEKQEIIIKTLRKPSSEKNMKDELSEFLNLKVQDTEKNKKTVAIKEDYDEIFFPGDFEMKKYQEEDNEYKKQEKLNKKLQMSPSAKIKKDKDRLRKLNKLIVQDSKQKRKKKTDMEESDQDTKQNEKTMDTMGVSDVNKNDVEMTPLLEGYVKKKGKNPEQKMSNKKLQMSPSDKMRIDILRENHKLRGQDGKLNEKTKDIKEKHVTTNDFSDSNMKLLSREIVDEYKNHLILNEISPSKNVELSDLKKVNIDRKERYEELNDLLKAFIKKSNQKTEDEWQNQGQSHKSPSESIINNERSEFKESTNKSVEKKERTSNIKQNKKTKDKHVTVNDFSESYIKLTTREVVDEYENQLILNKKKQISPAKKNKLSEFKKENNDNKEMYDESNYLLKAFKKKSGKGTEDEFKNQRKLHKSPSENIINDERRKYKELTDKNVEKRERTSTKKQNKKSIDTKENHVADKDFSESYIKLKTREVVDEYENLLILNKKKQISPAKNNKLSEFKKDNIDKKEMVDESNYYAKTFIKKGSKETEDEFENQVKLHTSPSENIINVEQNGRIKKNYEEINDHAQAYLKTMSEKTDEWKTHEQLNKKLMLRGKMKNEELKKLAARQVEIYKLLDSSDENIWKLKYRLSDSTFINKGWTKLPTEKLMRRVYLFRMWPVYSEYKCFKKLMGRSPKLYDTCEIFAEFNNGHGRWYYRNGRIALDYYAAAEETNAQQRFIIYSNGEPDEHGRIYPVSVLGAFDYLGNGNIFDHTGKTRLTYNQNEGKVLDQTIGPLSHWKWNSLNDPVPD